MNKDWIEGRRAELVKQNQEALSVYLQTQGALAILASMEAEQSKAPEEPPLAE